MLKASYLTILLACSLVIVALIGCPTGDDDTAGECVAAVPCEGNCEFENESYLVVVARCESISGDLIFHGKAWLTNIDLPCLASVGDDLEIINNATLNSLDGLYALTSVGDNLEIAHNNALTSIDMPTLTTVGDDLEIISNACLSQAEAEAFTSGLSVDGFVVANGTNHPCD